MVRLAVIVPMSNLVLEPELYRMSPLDVSLHFARVQSTPELSSSKDKWSDEIRDALDALGKDAARAAREFRIRSDQISVLALGCTSGTFHRGIEHENELVRSIQEASGILSITTSAAVVEALRELELKRLCVISPYAEYSHERALAFLTANGFEIAASKGLGLPNLEHSKLPPSAARDLALETCRGVDCDGIFSSCTAFRTMEILREVEQQVEKPMVSANQATLWLMLKRAGVTKLIKGFGALLERL